jgi:hypothetical protein
MIAWGGAPPHRAIVRADPVSFLGTQILDVDRTTYWVVADAARPETVPDTGDAHYLLTTLDGNLPGVAVPVLVGFGPRADRLPFDPLDANGQPPAPWSGLDAPIGRDAVLRAWFGGRGRVELHYTTRGWSAAVPLARVYPERADSKATLLAWAQLYPRASRLLADATTRVREAESAANRRATIGGFIQVGTIAAGAALGGAPAVQNIAAGTAASLADDNLGILFDLATLDVPDLSRLTSAVSAGYNPLTQAIAEGNTNMWTIEGASSWTSTIGDFAGDTGSNWVSGYDLDGGGFGWTLVSSPSWTGSGDFDIPTFDMPTGPSVGGTVAATDVAPDSSSWFDVADFDGGVQFTDFYGSTASTAGAIGGPSPTPNPQARQTAANQGRTNTPTRNSAGQPQSGSWAKTAGQVASTAQQAAGIFERIRSALSGVATSANLQAIARPNDRSKPLQATLNVAEQARRLQAAQASGGIGMGLLVAGGALAVFLATRKG